jgi:hypothetical protein
MIQQKIRWYCQLWLKYPSYMVRSPKHRGKTSSIGDVLSDTDNKLSTLILKARMLTQVQSLLAAKTDPTLAGQFQVAAIRQDRLILVTPSASWATRLRMHTHSMLQTLQQSGYEQLRFIDMRVAPLSLEPEKPRVQKQVSPAAKLAFKHMSQLSDSKKD